MTLEATGIIAARAIGLIFLLAGFIQSIVLVQDYFAHRNSGNSVGWTNYDPVDEVGDESPEVTDPLADLHLHDTYYTITPSIVTASFLTTIIGLAFLLLSKPIGGLLIRGIASTPNG